MRRYMVAGNWKLNMGPTAGAELAAGIQGELAGRQLKGDVLVCPPYVTIPSVSSGMFMENKLAFIWVEYSSPPT